MNSVFSLSVLAICFTLLVFNISALPVEDAPDTLVISEGNLPTPSVQNAELNGESTDQALERAKRGYGYSGGWGGYGGYGGYGGLGGYGRRYGYGYGYASPGWGYGYGRSGWGYGGSYRRSGYW